MEDFRPNNNTKGQAGGLFGRLIPFPLLAAVVALLVAVAVGAAGCGDDPSAGPGDLAGAEQDGAGGGGARDSEGSAAESAGIPSGGAVTNAPGAPSSAPGRSSTAGRPKYSLNLNSGTFSSGDEIPAPYYPHEPYYLTAEFTGAVDPAEAEGFVELEPADALMDLVWENEAGRGTARLRIRPREPGAKVEVTFREGMTYGSGRRLEDDETITVAFLPATEAQVVFEGSSYLPGGGKRKFKSAAGRYGPWPMMKPGAASVTISFTRKMNTVTVAPLLEELPFGSYVNGSVKWNSEGTAVTIPLRLEAGSGAEPDSAAHVSSAGSSNAGNPSASPTLPGKDDAPADELGMHVAVDGSSLFWQAAPAGEVRRVEGNIGSVGADPGNGRGVGTLPRLPEIRPVDGEALRGSRLLTWHHLSGDEECGTVGLTLWDITDGTGIPLGRGAPGCITWAAWAPDGEAVLYAGATAVHRFDVPSDVPLEDLLPDGSSLDYDAYILRPSAVIYDLASARPAGDMAPGETGTIRGFAPAADGKMAIFHSYPPGNVDGGSGDDAHLMDLVITDAAGKELSRTSLGAFAGGHARAESTVPASWSSDGHRLAFAFPGEEGAFSADAPRQGPAPSGETSGTDAATPGGARPGGDPSPLPAPLYIWEEDSSEIRAATVGGVTDVSWRSGSGEVLVKIGDGWYLYDTDGRRLTDVALMVPRPSAWSTDGRWLFGRRPRRPYAVADLRTNQVYKTPGWLPLGWNPADERPYWLRIS